MLNSRPLSYVYTEENCEPITPSNLLLGRDFQGHWFSTAIGDENIELSVMKCRKCYNHLLKLINDLRNELRENMFVNFDSNRCTITEGIVMWKNWYLTT